MAARSASTPTWQRASFCSTTDCVEVAHQDGMVLVRDSKDPEGRVLRYTEAEWQAFAGGVKAGEFDKDGADRTLLAISSKQPARPPRAEVPPVNQLDEDDRQFSVAMTGEENYDRVIRFSKYSDKRAWQRDLRRLCFIAANLALLALAVRALMSEGLSARDTIWIITSTSIGSGIGYGLLNGPTAVTSARQKRDQRRGDHRSS